MSIHNDPAELWATIREKITSLLPDNADVPIAQIQELALMQHYKGNVPGKGATEADEAPEAYAAAFDRAREVLFSWLKTPEIIRSRAELLLKIQDNKTVPKQSRPFVVGGKVVQTNYTAAGKEVLQLLISDLFFPWAVDCIQFTHSIINRGAAYTADLSVLNRATGILFNNLKEDSALTRASVDAIKALFSVELEESDAVPVEVSATALLPTSQGLQFALTVRDNKEAFITKLEEEFTRFFDENTQEGAFYLSASYEGNAKKKAREGALRVPLECVNLIARLYGGLLSTLQVKNPEDVEQWRGKNLLISLPQLAAVLGVDCVPLKARQKDLESGLVTNENRLDLVGILFALERIWADVKREQTFYRVLTIPKLHYGTEQLEISAPYLWYLYEQTIGKGRKADKINGKSDPDRYTYTKLIKTRRVGKNFYAQEIAARLVARLQQRGTTKDDAKQYNQKGERGRFTIRESFADIVKDIPQLYAAITEPGRSTADANKYLQRAFSFDKIVSVIEQGTDVCGYFKDFSISFEGPAGAKTPTVKTAGKWYIVMRHNGRQADYREGLRYYSLLPVKGTSQTWAAVLGDYSKQDFAAVESAGGYEAESV